MKRNKIFEGNTEGVSQLIDSPHKLPIELWKKGFANNWSPNTIQMGEDIRQWKEKDFLSEDERLLVKRTLGLFAMGESLVSNSIMLNEYRYITDGACRQYMLRKAFEESLHNFTVSVCCEAYSLDIKEVAEAYLNVKTIKEKDKFLEKSLSGMNSEYFNIKTKTGKREYLKNLVCIYLICEGCWFYPNFAMILSLGRQNKLGGLSEQILYTIKDESLHLEFGIYLINVIKQDYPEIWDKGLESEIIDLIKEAVDIEIRYSKEILPNGILGVNAEMLTDYVKFLANRRLESIGISFKFDSDKNPFPWLGEIQDSDKMTAFFEKRNKSYQNSASLVDDF